MREVEGPEAPYVGAVWLGIHPPQWEAAFWASSPALRSYLESIDRWLWFTVTVLNFLFIHLNFIYGESSLWLVRLYGCSVVTVYAQDILLLSRPHVYWKYRSIMTHFTIISRQIMLYLLSLNGAALCSQTSKQLATWPAWAVVVGLLSLVGALPFVVWRYQFPTSFRSTVVLSLLWLLLSLHSNFSAELSVLSLPGLAPGLHAVCSGVHTVVGNTLLLPPFLIRELSEMCAESSLWLVLFAHLLGFWWSIWHAYITELDFKVSFLIEHGFVVEHSTLSERVLFLVGFVVFAYISAHIGQFALSLLSTA